MHFAETLLLVLLPKLFLLLRRIGKLEKQQLLLLRKGLEKDEKWSLMLVQLQVSGKNLQCLVHFFLKSGDYIITMMTV